MDLGLQDKRVLITGATRGIGKATARLFAEEGARVAVTYHTGKDAADELVAELGGPGRALAVRHDLGDPAVIKAAVAEVEQQWGGIDVVVCNAQTFTWINPEDLSDFEDFQEDWYTKLRENSEGHLRTVQAALGGMRARGWGRVVLLSSVTATSGMYASEIYSAAKSALNGFVRGLMWTKGGVLSNVVAPGGTLTESFDGVDPAIVEQASATTPSGHLSTPQDVGRLIVFLCSEANGNINGEVINVAGGR
ncbi:SDR family oxidoreductase [Amycolatopsis sp. NPDC004079]|uniref:SDR family NAD(P)-dependent oxidoreductase n=1 Tax=Amycolatopsis halotolerans TaxID=330083 RepID=A0ABV7Q8X7_9PSEU